MRIAKKSVAIIAVLVLVIQVLAGCGKAEEPFTFSTGLSPEGRYEGVEALEYVELCDYIGISIPYDVHHIDEEEVQASIEDLLKSYRENIEVTNRPVESDDTVNIDYVGSIDGVEFEGGNTGGAGTDVTIGVTQYIDDFLEQLIGHSPGETFDVNVTFPEDYGSEELGNAHLNGKDAVFVTTINHIVDQVDPELTDAFVQEHFAEGRGWESVTGLREGIRSNLQEKAISEFVQDFILVASNVDDIPESVMAYQQKSLIRQYEDYAAYYNMEFDEFLPMFAQVETVEELLEAHEELNTQMAAHSLITQAIAEKESIEIKDGDLKSYFEKYAGSADYTQYKTVYGKPYLVMMVQAQHVIDLLMEHAVLEQE